MLVGEKIAIERGGANTRAFIRVDPTCLDQVIMNLVINARDAMPHGGILTIRSTNVSVEETRSVGQVLMPSGDYVNGLRGRCRYAAGSRQGASRTAFRVARSGRTVRGAGVAEPATRLVLIDEGQTWP